MNGNTKKKSNSNSRINWIFFFFLNEMTKAPEIKTLNISIAKHSERSQQFIKTVWWTEAVYFDAKKKRNYEKALDIEIHPFLFMFSLPSSNYFTHHSTLGINYCWNSKWKQKENRNWMKFVYFMQCVVYCGRAKELGQSVFINGHNYYHFEYLIEMK